MSPDLIDKLVRQYRDASAREARYHLLMTNAANDRAVALERLYQMGLSYAKIGEMRGIDISAARVGQIIRRFYKEKRKQTKKET